MGSFLDTMRTQAFFVLFQVGLALSASSCEDGWIDMDGESCLKLNNPLEDKSWMDVETECDILGGFLPELVTEAQKELFHDLSISYGNLFGGVTIFMGGSDLAHEGEWRWLGHGSTINDIVWGEGSPDTSPDNSRDCLAGDTNSSEWVDIDCFQAYDQVAFVCMTLQEGATTTEGTPGPSTEPSEPATTTYGPVDCPSGWTEFQGHCYMVMEEGMSWTDAKNACPTLADSSSSLVSIHSDAENTMVSEMVGKDKFYWTGGYREADEVDGWKWADGSAWDYTAWCKHEFGGCPDQPNNFSGDEYYVYGNLNGYWGDYKNTDEVEAIVCKI